MVFEEANIVIDHLTRSLDNHRFAQAKIAREEIRDDENEADEDYEHEEEFFEHKKRKIKKPVIPDEALTKRKNKRPRCGI